MPRASPTPCSGRSPASGSASSSTSGRPHRTSIAPPSRSWKRFARRAGAPFDRRRRQHFAQLSAQQGVVKAEKHKLIAEAEALATSTEWGPTASRLRDLMTEWKAAGRMGRAEEDALCTGSEPPWTPSTRPPADSFNERDAELSGNLASQGGPAHRGRSTAPRVRPGERPRPGLRTIGERWEAAGHVPRGDQERIEGRLRRVAETVRKAAITRWTRTNPGRSPGLRPPSTSWAR